MTSSQLQLKSVSTSQLPKVQEGPSLRPVLCTTKPLQPKPSTANSNQQSKLLSSHTENIHFTSQEREVISERQSAFKCFAPSLTPTTSRKNGIQRQNMLNRAIAYYKNFQPRRTDVLAKSATRAQFHHILSERRRREMINERFQELRKLLPSKVNKDKVSILTQTREYLASLQDLVAKLSQKNQQLESQLVPANEAAENVCESSSTKLLPQTKSGGEHGLSNFHKSMFLNGSRTTTISSQSYEEEHTSSESSKGAAGDSPVASVASCSSHFSTKRKRQHSSFF